MQSHTNLPSRQAVIMMIIAKRDKIKRKQNESSFSFPIKKPSA
jgi:hypothetical protein